MSKPSADRDCVHHHRHGLYARLRAALTGHVGLEYCDRCASWTSCDTACRLDEMRGSTTAEHGAVRPRI